MLQLPRTQNIRRHLSQNVDAECHLLEAQLLLLALAIGIQDAVAYPDYRCFASNQTGNTVVLAVGILHPNTGAVSELFSLSTVGVSLGVFVLGVLTNGVITNIFGLAAKRWWLLCTSLWQILLVILAAILQYNFSSATSFKTSVGLLTLALIAFASGLQVAMVRAMKISDITTATATAAYIDIFIDPKLLTGLTKNRGRNRRAGFLAMLITGSFIGAAGARYVSSAFALLLSIFAKVAAALLFLWTPAGAEAISTTSVC